MFKSCFICLSAIIFFTLTTLANEPMGFEGVWQTSYGRMRLISPAAGRIEGVYAFEANSNIRGTVDKNKLSFTYTEQKTKGQGWFELSTDAQSFEGQWLADGQTKWEKWTGKRLNPMKNTTWLIVLEANWESSLEDRELSFGGMLKNLFSHKQDVQVRHRYFSDEKSFIRMLNEVIFIPEPIVITIAAHGLPDGILTEEYKISAKTIADSLSYAASVKLLHFSSCLVMKNSFGKDIVKSLPTNAKFPVSGYKTSVDWMGSAIFEFMYFDLILNRQLSVKEASTVVTKLIPFGGSKQIGGSPFKSLDFDIQLP